MWWYSFKISLKNDPRSTLSVQIKWAHSQPACHDPTISLSSVADLDPGSEIQDPVLFWHLVLAYVMEKIRIRDLRSEINIPDHISASLETDFGFKIIKFVVNLVLRIWHPLPFWPLDPISKIRDGKIRSWDLGKQIDNGFCEYYPEHCKKINCSLLPVFRSVSRLGPDSIGSVDSDLEWDPDPDWQKLSH
jgi:hypothetical protein